MSEERDKDVFWKKDDTKTDDASKTIDVTEDSKKAAAAALKVRTPAKKVEHTSDEIDRNKDILLGLGFYKKANGGDKEQYITKEGNITVGRTFSHDYPAGKNWAMREGDLPANEKFLKDPEVKQLKIVQAFYAVRDKGEDISKYAPVDPRYTPQAKPQAPAQKQEVAIPEPQTVTVAQAPNEVIKEAEVMATALYNVVEKQHLFMMIGTKKYLQLEAWQLLGKFCQVHGIVESVEPVEYFGVQGFEAKAIIMDAKGDVIAAAEAVCMTDEPNWEGKPMFQLKSMSQTRALSKAYRSCLSFVVSIAGYAPTPLEEMEGVK
jgi:hypothetical protein